MVPAFHWNAGGHRNWLYCRKTGGRASSCDKENKMKKKGIMIVAFLILLAGAGVYFYPDISDLYYRTEAASGIKGYQKGVQGLSSSETDVMIAKAQEFNSRLSGSLSTDPFETGDVNPYEGDEEYNALLNINGVMGYIDIPKIDVYLPVYHGTSASTLKKGAGHLYGSALPAGGNGTHSVISAHRGLPSAKLFTDLDQMRKGDIFYFHLFDRVMAYQVDEIETVEPTKLELLDPVPGKEYMTLFTCTPYGVNSHRLLVRGIRIPYEVTDAESAAEQAGTDGPRMEAMLPAAVRTAIAAAVIMILLAAAFYMCRRRKNGKRGKR